MSDCCCVEARVGYVAAMEWRSVHVERPRSSMSGGQSFGIVVVVVGVTEAAAAVVVEEGDEEVDCLLAMRIQSRTDVQERHLKNGKKEV